MGHVFLPLLCGGVLYFGWRSSGLAVHRWLDAIGLAALVEEMRAQLAGIQLPAFVTLSVPDALWCYALVAHLGRLWVGSPHQRLWLAFAVFVGVGCEVGQAAGIVPGTFDPYDLLAIASACALAIVLLSHPRRTSAWTVTAAY